MRYLLAGVLMLVCLSNTVAAPNVNISAAPYLAGGLFTNPVFPVEGQEVAITVRASCTNDAPCPFDAHLTLRDAAGSLVTETTLSLDRNPASPDVTVEAVFRWMGGPNGLYTARVELDPANVIAEENEEDNTAELAVPVVVQGRALHFPWYSEWPAARWATCITSASEAAQARLFERGVLPLNWEYGGQSWSYYDKEQARTHPEKALAEIEEVFYKKFASEAKVYGFGIDECGGYPNTWTYDASIASMKGLIRARKTAPGRFFAVWNSGGLRPELAGYYRQAADLLLLETYLWRALPDELGADDTYQVIVDRIEPIVRGTDMFQPAYFNHCYTLIAFDTSERPDRIDLGEQEQAVRFVRRRFPEMRGIAWYNAGYGMEKNAENDRVNEAVQANADRLCFEYFVKPCVTLMQESLWMNYEQDGSVLTAALSNIGGMDAHEVAVAFQVDGAVVGQQTTERVPAGPNRSVDRVLLKQPIQLTPGAHTFEARILSAPGATVLDSRVTLDRFVP